jgi:magnesium-protoporphyrin O-methyltransferase
VLCSCDDYQRAADRQFTPKKAAAELQAYRRGRIGSTTRLLRDGLIKAGLNQGSLLDVGAGVGPLAFELLDRGVTTAVLVEASSAYAEASREEATRRGRTTSVQVVQGDFLQVSETVAPADIVTLDRVICCYPSYEPLLERVLRHATRGFALSYPKDRWYVRAAVWFDNAKRAGTTAFLNFVHPPRRMQEIIQSAGFELASRRATMVWTVDVFMRPQN